MSFADNEVVGKFNPATSEVLIGVKQHYKKIIAFVVISVAITAAILQIIQPTYQSTVTLMIEPKSFHTIKIDEVAERVDTREFFNSQVEIIKSRDNALKVIHDMRLWEIPEFKQSKSSTDGLLSGVLAQIPFLNLGEVKKTTDQAFDENKLVEKFGNNLHVEPVRLTSLVKVKFDSNNPKTSQNVASAIARTYIFSDRDIRLRMTREANKWATDRLDGLKEKLIESEKRLQDYREAHGIVKLDGSVETIAAQQIGDVTQRLVEARVKRAELQSAYVQIQKITNGDYSSVPYVIRSPVVLEGKNRESAAMSKVAELKERYGLEHPKMIAAESELRAAQDSLKTQMALVVNSLKREYEVANSTVSALEGTLSSARSSLTSVNRSGSQLAVLERDVETNKNLYETFLSRAKETGELDTLQAPVARVVESATEGVKIKPQKALILVLVTILTSVLGVLAAVWRSSLENGVKGAEDAEERLGYQVLSSVPVINESKLASNLGDFFKEGSTPFDAMLLESVKTAATSILLSNIDGDNKVIMVTSTVSAEGKSTFTSLLSLVLSSKQRVLLVDCDFRRPRVAKYFGFKHQTNGLVDAIVNHKPIDECVQRVENSNVYVMNSGKSIKNALDLIHSNEFKQFILRMKEQFDYVLIDTPPVELVSDALAVTGLADKTIFVVKAYETDIRLVRKSLSRLVAIKENIMGLVVNRVDFARSYALYGEYGAYGNYDYYSDKE